MILLFIVTTISAKITLEPKCWYVEITPVVVTLMIFTKQGKEWGCMFDFNFSFVLPKPTSLVKQLLHVSVYLNFLIWLWFVLSPLKFLCEGSSGLYRTLLVIASPAPSQPAVASFSLCQAGKQGWTLHHLHNPLARAGGGFYPSQRIGGKKCMR